DRVDSHNRRYADRVDSHHLGHNRLALTTLLDPNKSPKNRFAPSVLCQAQQPQDLLIGRLEQLSVQIIQ
ncbi:hypothetical protein H6F50_14805, partial [Coleofasciculus sp. FACHB-712]|uniref:hypothetical protein n=1 Tax=Coleofasciculus sp. FACHB-712 TaxID=2692789 RepID=UPI001687D256